MPEAAMDEPQTKAAAAAALESDAPALPSSADSVSSIKDAIILSAAEDGMLGGETGTFGKGGVSPTTTS